MVASYKQCEELGYESVYYVNPAFIPFLPKDSRAVSATDGKRLKTDLAIFLFPSQKNLPLIWKLKRQGGEGGVYLPRASGSDEGVSRSRLL
ncbi:hypothetical protein NXW61_22540 [Bacteroides xylanisolvens]|nr:hypothetical protein [Bacteroides xylanisolvens]